MNYLWLLLPPVILLLAWKITSPAFLVELVAQVLKNILPVLFKSSPHSKEYWDLEHRLQDSSNREERRDLEWKIKELLIKEAKNTSK